MQASVFDHNIAAPKTESVVEQYFRLLYGEFMQGVSRKRIRTKKKRFAAAEHSYDRTRPWIFMMSQDKKMTYRAATFSTLFSLLWDEDKDTTYYTPNSFYRSDQRLADYARWIHAIAIDIDTKSEDQEGITVPDILDRIKDTGLPLPTIIVKTPSSGYHVTWALSQEQPVRATFKTVRLFEAIQRHISEDLAGDRYAIGVERYFRTPTEENICFSNPVKFNFQTFIDWREVNHPYDPTLRNTRPILQEHNIMGHPAIQRLYNMDAPIGDRDAICFTLILAMKFSGYTLARAEVEMNKWWHECCEKGTNKNGLFTLKDTLQKVRSTYKRKGKANAPSPEVVRKLTGLDFQFFDLKAKYYTAAKPRELRQRVHHHEWLDDLLNLLNKEGEVHNTLPEIASQLGCAVSTLKEVLKKGTIEGLFDVQTKRGRNGRTIITSKNEIKTDIKKNSHTHITEDRVVGRASFSIPVDNSKGESSMFDREFIDGLCSAVDLTALMRSYGVSVKEGTGKNNFYIADWCCGKTDYDNGRIDLEKQSYRCMSCMPLHDSTLLRKSKNAIHFLREHEGLSYRTAVLTLCEFVGMEPPDSSFDGAAYVRKQQALEFAVEFYAGNLTKTTYLLDRGVSQLVMKRHRVGYATGGSQLKDYLCGKGYSEKELLEYQLVNKNGMDRFYKRVIIPVIHKGKIVDLYGRSVRDSEMIKHLYLYGDFVCGGIDLVDPAKVVCIFESAIDRLVAESYGISNGIDPGGALKFNGSHIRFLKDKDVHQTVTIFDGDEAGEKGSLLVGKLLTEQDVSNYVVELPSGEDVSEILLQSGVEGITQFTKRAVNYERFRNLNLLKKMDVEDIRFFFNNLE
ncbi:DNA primase [compost metagenome]